MNLSEKYQFESSPDYVKKYVKRKVKTVNAMDGSKEKDLEITFSNSEAKMMKDILLMQIDIIRYYLKEKPLDFGAIHDLVYVKQVLLRKFFKTEEDLNEFLEEREMNDITINLT